MSRFAVLLICIYIFIAKNSYCQSITSGPLPAAGVPFSYNNGCSDVFYGPSVPAPSIAAYGGVGEGNVVVIGELPVSGTTTVTGQVPIMGAVSFNGPVPAYGTVSIIGSCTCSCGSPFMY